MSGETETNGDHRVAWRVYVDALVTDLRQTLEHEGHDRETTAQALRAEHAAAMQLAAEEREKAAQALRLELTRATSEGDERLREHIAQAIEQVNAALASSEKLEIERVAGVAKQLASVQRQIEIAQDAQKEAVLKAETADERRFNSVNEFRAQLADQQSTYITREAVEGLIRAIEVRVTGNDQRITRVENVLAARSGGDVRSEQVSNRTLALIGIASPIFLALTVLVINLLIHKP